MLHLGPLRMRCCIQSLSGPAGTPFKTGFISTADNRCRSSDNEKSQGQFTDYELQRRWRDEFRSDPELRVRLCRGSVLISRSA
jgi:hypothetical protein